MDTASDWVILETSDCELCDQTTVFNYTDSDKHTTVGYNEEKLIYKSGKIHGGDVYTDRFCFEEKC